MEASIVAVIGSVLTAGAGLLIDSRREKVRIKKSRSLLVEGVCSDLEQAICLYGRLLKEWQQTGRLWPTTIKELQRSSSTYHNNPEWLGLFDELGCSKEIYQYHNSIVQLLAQLAQKYTELSVLDHAERLGSEAGKTVKSDIDVLMSALIQSRRQAKELLQKLQQDTAAQAA